MSTLVKSKALPTLRSMMEDFWDGDKFFQMPFLKGEKLPAVNVSDRKDHYEVEVAVPGYHKEDLKITSANGVLTISGENKMESKETKNDYMRQEFSCSSFTRTFTLPEDTQEDHVEAKYDNGILKVNLKKAAKVTPSAKEIKIS